MKYDAVNQLEEIITTPILRDYWRGIPEGKRSLVVPRIECDDGATFSVQASYAHYCDPRNNEGPWTSVEISTSETPCAWDKYADGTIKRNLFGRVQSNSWFDGMYAHVPVELVRKVLMLHDNYFSRIKWDVVGILTFVMVALVFLARVSL